MSSKKWKGIPREEISWYPTIDAEKCEGCGACVEFCKYDVLEINESAGKARVKNPYNCPVLCQACASLCPVNAISFPTDEELLAMFIKKIRKKEK